MYRSSSTSRASDEFLVNLVPAEMGSPPQKAASSDDLPIYNSFPDATKKEVAFPNRSPGEETIHLIPLVLVLCGLILWIFSDSSLV
ncbi:hypothetical protein CJ030_MR6G010461 [Morella rubra]|uniref:Uncharacterized protein n=1 Tax=Morella rubra TaxID=262757 RepID=A0A6A1V842_9ROSI|nr:hypothetical protein CJ030_MR6G010461 [Morella rubra]